MIRLFALLTVLFIVIPTIEITLLVLLGHVTDSWLMPILIVVGTGILGAALSRWQGAGVYWRIQSELRAGKLPTTSLLDGFLILVAGLLLITPGVLSDLVGISLLIPPIRLLYRLVLLRWITRYFKLPSFPASGFTASGFASNEGPAPSRSRVIESYVIEKSEIPESSSKR